MKGEKNLSRLTDMTGWVMAEHGVPDSRLTVIERVQNAKDGKARWLCECSCKERNKIIAAGVDIRNGHTLSCGCLRIEALNEINQNAKKYNQYNLIGEYGIGWTSNTNKEFYFDLEDYDEIKDYCWYECVDSTGYHYLATTDENHKKIKMSNLIAAKNFDHQDRNPFNNRKSNLRFATVSENARNRSISRSNTSGFIGVYWDSTHKKWKAQITLDHKHISVGSVAEKYDAIVARLKAEQKYYGEFAPQKHLFEQYKINVEDGDN